MTEFIALDTSIELSKWDSAINQMIADAARVEKALSFNSVSIRVDVDDAALVDAVGLVDRLNSGSANVRIDATVSQELQNAQTLINRIDSEDATVTLDALLDPEFERAAQMVAKLDSGKATIDIDATVDTELKNAQDLINRLDSESADVEITATDNASDVIKKIQAQLQNLQQLATISLVLDAADFITGLDELPFFSTIADQETAAAITTAQTTRDIVDKGAIIEETYTNAFGESRAEIAHFLVGMANVSDETGNFIVANEDLADSVTGLFEAQNATMLDTEEIFQAATALVQNGLVPTYREAYDFITQGAREGLNVNNDLLTSIDEYTLQFAEAGISAEGFYNVLRTSAETGQFQTDKAVDLIKESTNLAREEIEDFNQTGTLTPRVEQIQKLDLMEEGQAFAQGEITGEEWLSAVLSKIDELPTEAEKRFAELQIFGPTQVEEVGSGFLEALDFAKDVDWEGAATEGAAVMNDTLSVTLEETARTFDSALSAVLNNVIGQEGGFLDQLKSAALAFADEIQAGGTLGSAIELALQLPEGQIARIESAIGNFLIGILEVTANLGEFLGADVSGIRDTIADTAKGQLTFDLQSAVNEEEIADAYERAIARGVSGDNAQAAARVAIDEMLAAGDIAGARAAVASIAGVVDTEAIEANISSLGSTIVEGASNAEHAIERLEYQANNASRSAEERAQLAADAELLRAAPTVDTTGLQTQVDTFVADLYTGLSAAVSAKDWTGALDIANKLGLDNAEQLVSDLHLGSQLSAIKVPAEIDFDPNSFNMQGMTDSILVELNGAESQLTEKQVTVANVSMRIVDDVEGAEETVTSSIPTFTAAEEVITGSGVEVSNVTMRIVDDSAEAATATTEASGEMNLAFAATAIGSAALFIATGNYNALASAIGSSAPGLVSQLGQISDALSGFANAGSKALEVSGGLQTSGNSGPVQTGKGFTSVGHAEGGVKPEGMGGWVGEQGPEWQVAGQDVSILNNQTSEALWTAMQSMGARGGGGSVTNNYYNNIVVTNNNASGAQAVNTTQALANKVRGF